MTEELGAISVGLGVGLGTLDRDLAAIEKKIKPLEREHLIPFAVGKVSFTAVQKEIERLTQRAIPVQLTVAKGTGARIHRDLTAQLKAAGPVSVQVKANFSASEVSRIKAEIGKALASMAIPIRVTAPQGGGPASAPAAPTAPAPARAAPVPPAVASASAAPVSPPPRASTARTASKTTPPAAPTPAAAAPAPAQPTPPPAARGSSRAQTAKERATSGPQSVVPPATPAAAAAPAAAAPAAAKKPRGSRKAATPAAAVPPAPGEWTFEQARKAGNIIDLNGKSEEEIADALGEPKGKMRGVVRQFRKRATGGGAPAPSTPMSMLPQTEEEIEYASRPMAASLPLDEQALAEQEKRGRGARGVGRAGLRRPGERVQSADEIAQVDRNVRSRNARNARERDREIRQPAHESAAYWPQERQDAIHPRLRQGISSRQMSRINPKLGDVYDAWMRGDMETARGELAGLSLEMKGASGTRMRRRYMRQLRSMERARPEDVEKDAALGAMFAAIRTTLDPDSVLQHGADYVPSKPTSRAKAAAAPKASEVLGQIPGLDQMKADLGILSTKDFADADERHKAERRVVLDHMHRQGIRDLKPGQRVHQADAVLKALREAVEPEGREQGGPVEGALMRAIRLAKERKEGQYLVGEKRPETFRDMRGNTEIIGEDGPEVRTFDRDGTVIPFVPEWVRRQKQNAKDFTGHRARGGPVKADPQFKGRLAAEPESGLIGRGKKYRSGAPGELEAIAAGELSSKGGVQRVFVTNWPAGSVMGGRSPIRSRPGDANGMAAAPWEGGGDVVDRLLAGMAKVTRTPRTRKPAAGREPADTSPTRLDPEQSIKARLDATSSVAEMRSMLVGMRSTASETQSFAPVRSLAPAIGQIFGTALGRGELVKRLNLARDLISQAADARSEVKRSEAEEKKLQARIDDPRTSADKRSNLIVDLEKQAAATKIAASAFERLSGEASEALKSADAFSLKLGTMIGNTAGIAVGTLAFGASLGALQAGLSAAGEVMGPIVERMMGFTSTSAAVTKALGEQVKAQGGSAESAWAMAAAQAGLSASSADMLGPVLKQRAATEQNNQTLQQGIDLLHTYEEARRRGGSQGIFATTGGFAGSMLGGVASTQELVRKELTSPDAMLSEAERQSREKALRGESVTTYAGGVSAPKVKTVSPEEVLAASDAKAAILQDRLDFFNDAIEKGGSKLRLVAGASDDAAKQFASAADKAGLTELSAAARSDNKVILVDSSGQPVLDRQKIVEGMTAINTGQQVQDPELLIKAMTDRIIPAQKALFAAEAKYQRQFTLPAQSALSQIASPTPGLEGGPAFGAGLVGVSGGKTDEAARSAAASYRSQVGGAIKEINAEIAHGREAMMNIVPPELRTEFGGVLSDIESLGKQISGIQIGIQQQQVNLQVAEYNNQLRIARRSLQDAKDLQQGIAGATKDTLGGIEGQTIALQRQLQLLQFELQQRQINFKLATAGFVAPGTTPEERAARIEAAKKEAEFAQKQLDIQRKLADLSYKGVTITADRSVTDLVAQIGLLEQGREVTVNTAAASRALEILNKRQQQLIDKAGTYLEEGTKIATAIMQASSEIQKETGKGFGLILEETAKAWGIFGDQAAAILSALTGVTHNSDGSRSKGGKFASGIVGDTLGPTQITVGEAGGEKVAVLKNPKIVPTANLGGALGGGGYGGGGGAMVNMTVVITGNSIREEGDLVALAEMVARKVEDRLMTKTNLFGMRRV